ncbi:hypothetical protein SAMN02745136_02982 [Anaerocolumna jejuensis DSM 15929]|jgi:hypothetical protein|uniref:Uncharacterized protein n=1 Tax=Anaerocolumna jejuensis DSM 15929 TaxID=1121322 RepID=A0A1M6U3Z7_9FIRM|nr:hypothetical protein [Anaerocolumna jejuensis]SHK63907.1 hypothetical protein SAMN02745136_02982 [Anaerocolumna jejuensis DSM 15929]
MLKLEVTFDEINYAGLAAGLIPMLLENLSRKDVKSKEAADLIANLGDAPERMLTAAFGELPQQDMNNLISGIVSIYREDLMKIANDKLKEQNISGGITDIRLENV